MYSLVFLKVLSACRSEPDLKRKFKYPTLPCLKVLGEHENIYNEYLQSFLSILGGQRLNNITWEANPPMRLVLLIRKVLETRVESQGHTGPWIPDIGVRQASGLNHGMKKIDPPKHGNLKVKALVVV